MKYTEGRDVSDCMQKVYIEEKNASQTLKFLRKTSQYEHE